MYYDQNNGRRSPIILATLMLMILALSFFNLGTRYAKTLRVPGEAGAYELIAAQRHSVYYYANEATAASWEVGTVEAAQVADWVVTQDARTHDYQVTFTGGGSFTVAPGLLSTTVTTSQGENFAGRLGLRDGLHDASGRSLTAVYPAQGQILLALAQSDSHVLLAHGPRLLIGLVLILAAVVIKAKRRQITWLSQYSWQPAASLATSAVLLVLALMLSARIF